MYNEKKFTILGGDGRMVGLANIISKDYVTYTYGIESDEMDSNIVRCSNLEDAIQKADVIIGPLPLSTDGENLNCSFFNEKISLKEIFSHMTQNQLFFSGYVSGKAKDTAKYYNLSIRDYFEREEFAILNCIPTAEGAIQKAMEETPFTIHGSNCLVLGYGRIGKILSKMLQAIGANIYVEARKYSDLAWIQSMGYTRIALEQLENYIGSMDIIFNTIPSLILGEEQLKRVKKDCLIIDLASKPGGVDFEMAKQLGIKVIWALALPGKVAPMTAANIIKTTIFNIMNELGV